MVLSGKSRLFSTAFFEYVLALFSSLGAILIIHWLLKYSAYGIDFTDESFYLVSILNPFLYPASITQFGFIYHPLYLLLNGDIVALRQANLLLTFGLGFCLTYIFLKHLVEIKGGSLLLSVISSGFAVSSFIFFDSWLLTPSYNSLALQSLMISSIGLLLAGRCFSFKNAVGWFLIGVGGWLAFMAKPSTAVLLAVSTIVYLLLSRKFSIRLLALSTTCMLLLFLASAMLIDGTILGFWRRLKLGVDYSQVLGGGHSLGQLFRIDNFQLDQKTIFVIWIFLISLFIAFWSFDVKAKKWSLVGVIISITFFVLTASVTLGWIDHALGFGQFQDLLIFGIVFPMICSILVLHRNNRLTPRITVQWPIFIFLMTTPYIYAFGTNRNYWQNAGSADIFWLLGGVTLLAPLIRGRAAWLMLLSIALATEAVTAMLLQTGLEQPYRQPQALRLNSSPLAFGPGESQLILSSSYAEYISKAVEVAHHAGFISNTPVIDLSGQSPGVLFALGAKSIGQAWVIGDYPGSLSLSKLAFGNVSCQTIAHAWVLLEPDGPRNIPIDLMTFLGANFPADYKLVGTWVTAVGAGGYAFSRRQELYEPVLPNETLKLCLNLRKGADL